MPVYLFLCTLLGALIVLGRSTEGILPVLLFSVYPVGWYWSQGHRFRAVGLPVLMWLGAAVVSGDFLLALVLLFGLLPGILLGTLILQRQTPGRCLAAVTAVLFLFVGGSYALMWPAVSLEWHQAFENYIEQMSQNASDLRSENAIATFRWLDGHWAYVSFGLLFGMILLCQLLLVLLLFSRLQKRAVLKGTRYSAGRLRMPEPLVWVAIVVALGWFWDSYYPNDSLRLVVWNSAIMLAFIYLVNGISITAFALVLFRFQSLWLAFAVLILILFNLYQLLPFIGFFDTWINFRAWLLRMRHRQLKAKDPDL
ncbi:MAG TPA: DUF2232 domain-containing protein [Candidatus Hydrogenedentes bacterium]|jgi:hypothetical protein|nr:MAG: hypothetical protein BWY07_01111 [Candidatus Hydrogenedentes bacterium ADurb.Bin170]HNZ47849.1 DUF2232 domain-containing protein [Candidatus Hydrogenedentota bacterium]HOD94432.1 DUF2232 domain-containing protein [Candidatus Hydrogenedentota bacterium]HOH42391.1 DUF2232 domain-containing protein [Candidatus Hydrogenedentota bacterium]HOM47795.1 DUF2232 domain-containing protein [Candidatus Hydrogenedentota bacterium]